MPEIFGWGDILFRHHAIMTCVAVFFFIKIVEQALRAAR
jgi:hypothetical protein